MVFVTTGASQDLGHARPADPGRDIGAIADLIEAAFSQELDRTGNNLVAEMRQLASLGPLLTIADRVASFPSGYVWERAGRVVGNATLTIEDAKAGRWFISNVAVHPDYQGRGIGRRLMEEVLASVRRRGGRQVLLQVRTDNEPAQRLYHRLAFERFDTVVEMVRPGSLPAHDAPSLALRRLGNRDWEAQWELARAATPAEVQRIRALDVRAFHLSPGRRLQDWLDGLLGIRQTQRWGLMEGDRLLAAVSVMAHGDAVPSRLDLTVRPGYRGRFEGPLADAGLAALARWHPRSVAATLSTSHGEALQALKARHFNTLRSLDQMVLELRV